MKPYLPRYLVMYAVLAGVFALVSAIVRFPSAFGVLIPGLLAALVAQGYVNDHLQAPTTREKVEFAGLASALSAVIGTAMMLLSMGLIRGALSDSGGGPATPELTQLLGLAAFLFVLNAITIFIGTGLGARGALHRIAYPELHLDPPPEPGPTPPADQSVR
jgi:hypothetical protein